MIFCFLLNFSVQTIALKNFCISMNGNKVKEKIHEIMQMRGNPSAHFMQKKKNMQWGSFFVVQRKILNSKWTSPKWTLRSCYHHIWSNIYWCYPLDMNVAVNYYWSDKVIRINDVLFHRHVINLCDDLTAAAEVFATYQHNLQFDYNYWFILFYATTTSAHHTSRPVF